MTALDWVKDYLNDLCNIILRLLVKHTYFRTTTIWAIMKRIDEQVNKQEMEYYIDEYQKWKNQGFKTRF